MSNKTNLLLLLGILLPLPFLVHANPIFGDFAVVDDLPSDPQNAVWFEGTFGEGTLPLDLQGVGTRMFWYPGKAAFRGGRDLWPYGWVEQNIGSYSFSWGLSNTASGFGSTSFGDSSSSSGSLSFSAGEANTASGSGATALGARNIASGSSSLSTGEETLASGNAAASFNNFTMATGYSASSFGVETQAHGGASFTMGDSTIADSYGEVVIGRNNQRSNGNPNSWSNEDPVFVIGNGIDWNNRSNALTVLKSGNIGIGVLAPQHLLDVDGDARISGDLIVDGNVVSDVNLQDDLNVGGNLGIVGNATFSGNVTTNQIKADFGVLEIESGSGYISYGGPAMAQYNHDFWGDVGLLDGDFYSVDWGRLISNSGDAFFRDIEGRNGQLSGNLLLGDGVTSSPELKIQDGNGGEEHLLRTIDWSRLATNNNLAIGGPTGPVPTAKLHVFGTSRFEGQMNVDSTLEMGVAGNSDPIFRMINPDVGGTQHLLHGFPETDMYLLGEPSFTPGFGFGIGTKNPAAGKLDVALPTVFRENVEMDGDARISGDLTIDGNLISNVNLQDNLNVGGNLGILGDATFTGNVTTNKLSGSWLEIDSSWISYGGPIQAMHNHDFYGDVGLMDGDFYSLDWGKLISNSGDAFFRDVDARNGQFSGNLILGDGVTTAPEFKMQDSGGGEEHLLRATDWSKLAHNENLAIGGPGVPEAKLHVFGTSRFKGQMNVDSTLEMGVAENSDPIFKMINPAGGGTQHLLHGFPEFAMYLLGEADTEYGAGFGIGTKTPAAGKLDIALPTVIRENVNMEGDVTIGGDLIAYVPPRGGISMGEFGY